ncbi:MAG: permease-like cell division protein FtsX [Bacteroidota bacterium]
MTQSNASKNSKTKPNYVALTISMSLVLFLFGLFALILIQANFFVDYIKENVQIQVELKDDVPEMEVLALQKKLEGSRFCKPGSVQFIDKDAALEIMKDEFEESLSAYGMNPLFDAINFKVRASYMQSDSLFEIAQLVKEDQQVVDVYYEQQMVDQVASNLRKIAWIVLGLGILSILLSLTLINSTIKLALYSNRFLIKTMQTVGAPWPFIRKPYLSRSVSIGLIACFLALLLLGGIIALIETQFPGVGIVHHVDHLFIVFIAILVLGLGVSYSTTYFGINRYLKTRIEDLY